MEVKKGDEKRPPRYKSQQGFTKVPLVRGFTEIAGLFKALQVLGDGSFICGGYARYCASPNVGNRLGKAGDVDIYGPTDKTFERVRDYFKFEKVEIRHENDMAITYRRPKSGPYQYCPTIQLIKPMKEGRVVAVGTMEEILENFDFTVVRAAIVNEGTVLVDADFMHDEERKILRLKNIHCPISSTLRCMKYAAKGYWLPPRQALSLFLDWEARTDAYREELLNFIMRIDNDEKLTKEEINKFEALMRRD
jgi:hypothetical protein